MQANPKTGTMSKFVMCVTLLREKLMEIGNHLRDCSQDITDFSVFLADQLKNAGPEMKPWGFAQMWREAIHAILALRDASGPHSEIEEKMKNLPEDHIPYLLGLRQIFATDLCGSDFAEVMKLSAEDHVGKNESSPRQSGKLDRPKGAGEPVWVARMNEKYRQKVLADLSGLGGHNPFPPEPPVVEESAKKPWANDSDRLSDVERIPRPPDNDLRHHGSWDF